MERADGDYKKGYPSPCGLSVHRPRL